MIDIRTRLFHFDGVRPAGRTRLEVEVLYTPGMGNANISCKVDVDQEPKVTKV